LGDYSEISDEQLVRACAESNDGVAWNEFVSRFRRPISLSIIRTVRKWGQAPQQVVDDLVQETYLKLCTDHCRLLLAFAVRHPGAVPGYIKIIAVNVAHDYFKSVYSQKRGAGQAHESLADIDPIAGTQSQGGPAAIENQIFLKQIDEYLGSCSAGPDPERDRIIFWLYHEQRWTAKEIAALPTIELTPEGVESAILRLKRLVRQHFVDLRAKPPGGSDGGEKDFGPQNRIS
jgi:RNA polymerase sigma-70 factor (ECF subfamily)